MDNRIITDITNYIFLSDRLQKVDVIFLPGGSFPEIPERAAKLYHDGYAPLLLTSGGVSVKSGKFNGAKSKTDIYDKEYKTDCEFYTDVLLKNGVPRDSIICEYKSDHTRDNAFMSRKSTNENVLRGRGLDIFEKL